MKKITAAALAVSILGACQTESATFKGKNYQLEAEDNVIAISLNFDSVGENYSGKVVNNYFGSYSTGENNAIFFGPAGATMMMGAREEMEAEGHYFQLLPQVSKFSLEGDTLTLYTTNGEKLVFKETSAVAGTEEDDF